MLQAFLTILQIRELMKSKIVKATIAALGEMRDARTVAQNRGVSLSTVFNG